MLVGARLQVGAIGPHDMRSRGQGRSKRGASRGVSRATWISRGELLHDAVIVALHRQGKQLAIEAADGRVLVVQLGMSGQLLLQGERYPVAPGEHRHIEWRILGDARAGAGSGRSSRGRTVGLVFRDPRRFGGVHAAPNMAALRVGAWRGLGPDALAISAAALGQAIGTGDRAIKAALLDQRFIAGVGNIYADEALFRAGIRPSAPARRIVGVRAVALASAIRAVLRAGVVHGGSTLRDHRMANGERGKAQDSHAVYGRGGQPCTRCATPLRAMRLAGRATVFCAACQK